MLCTTCTLQAWKKEHKFNYVKAPGGRLKTQQAHNQHVRSRIISSFLHGLFLAEVIEAVNTHLEQKPPTKEVFVATGVGNHQMMSCQFIRWKKQQAQSCTACRICCVTIQEVPSWGRVVDTRNAKHLFHQQPSLWLGGVGWVHDNCILNLHPSLFERVNPEPLPFFRLFGSGHCIAFSVFSDTHAQSTLAYLLGQNPT